MFKNQLQELAQRSCFNLPCYTCIREGPDHAPRFKSSVNFNGEIFDSPTYCTTLRQAEHSAAEVALNALSSSGPSRSLTARVLDETGVYKNLLQETAHRAGLNLPVYTTVRSGPGHLPVFTSTVELAGMSFVGESAKTKKQAEKYAAIAAWSSLKTMPNLISLSLATKEGPTNQMRVSTKVSSSNGTKDHESRVIRKRHFNQSRRRLVRSFQDNGSSNPKDTKQQQQQHLKLVDLFLDSKKEGSSSTENKNWFASLLPPPPPRTISKILPPVFPPLGKMQEKDGPNPISETISGNNLENRTKIHKPIGMHSYNVGYGCHNNPRSKFAPAVQIRSVIPVCAAPPPPPRPLRPSSSSSSSLALDSPEAKLTGSQPGMAELSSSFNKLRL